jgi:hypothetical protein
MMTTRSRINEALAPDGATTGEIEAVVGHPAVADFLAILEPLCALVQSGNPLALRLMNTAYATILDGLAQAEQVSTIRHKVATNNVAKSGPSQPR